MLKCVAVEVDKRYTETKIQLLLSPVALGCRDSMKPPNVDSLLATMMPESATFASTQTDAPANQPTYPSGTGTLRSRESAQSQSARSGHSGGSGCRERTEFEQHLSDGFVILSAMQFRAHAMFSRARLPLAVDTLEYAWLIEILLGSILARINVAHVCFSNFTTNSQPPLTLYIHTYIHTYVVEIMNEHFMNFVT